PFVLTVNVPSKLKMWPRGDRGPHVSRFSDQDRRDGLPARAPAQRPDHAGRRTSASGLSCCNTSIHPSATGPWTPRAASAKATLCFPALVVARKCSTRTPSTSVGRDLVGVAVALVGKSAGQL